ncbi:MAG: MmgE/PrpD family protein, partial [bacterium]|nr:MmgE/PrpD family protein [bacterium]
DFSDEALGDPTIRALIPKVRCVKDEELGRAWPERWPAVVVVETQDGRSLTLRVDDPKGDPANPLTEAEIVGKFTELTTPCYSADQRAQLIEAALGIGNLESLEPLWALLAEETKTA